MREYTVVYERGENNWSAYSPDVPGCVAAAKTREEIETLFKEALEFHIEGLLADGQLLPEGTTETGTVRLQI